MQGELIGEQGEVERNSLVGSNVGKQVHLPPGDDDHDRIDHLTVPHAEVDDVPDVTQVPPLPLVLGVAHPTVPIPEVDLRPQTIGIALPSPHVKLQIAVAFRVEFPALVTVDAGRLVDIIRYQVQVSVVIQIDVHGTVRVSWGVFHPVRPLEIEVGSVPVDEVGLVDAPGGL